MGIELYNNNRPKIWRVITGNHLLNHENNNGLIVVNSVAPVTIFLSNILPPGFSTKIIQEGAGTATIVAMGGITTKASQGVTSTGVPGDTLTISSHLPNSFIIEAAGSLVGGGGGAPTKLRRYKSANFADATNINDAWFVGKTVSVFWNDVQRYLDNTEFDITGTGLQITMPGFDAAISLPTFFVMESEEGGGGGGGGV